MQLQTDQCVVTHTDVVTCLGVSENNTLIVAGSKDCTVSVLALRMSVAKTQDQGTGGRGPPGRVYGGAMSSSSQMSASELTGPDDGLSAESLFSPPSCCYC